jgi:hypothetical protein
MKSIAGLVRVLLNCRPSRMPRALFRGLAGVLILSTLANANPWVPIANPVNPNPSNFLPGPKLVPGKDFSDVRDRNATGLPDPEQVVAWDGSGGVRDSFDYSGTRLPPLNQDIEVDGLAAGGDALFSAVRGNQAALLFSVETDPNVMFERETGLPASPPGFGVWATATDIDAMNPPLDTDALEVWGGDNNDDSDRYSLAGDPPFPGLGKIAIWGFTPPIGPSNPHTLTTDLAAAMDKQYGGPGVGGPYWSHLVELMDVDAIMTFGPEVLFSIRPLDLAPFSQPGGPLLPTFDGGEIFDYTPGAATKFLNHGGHLWDTLFDVRATFQLNHENVDALEAVAGIPEPTGIALFLLGLIVAPQFTRRWR